MNDNGRRFSLNRCERVIRSRLPSATIKKLLSVIAKVNHKNAHDVRNAGLAGAGETGECAIKTIKLFRLRNATLRRRVRPKRNI